jgi:hypothetical protein
LSSRKGKALQTLKHPIQDVPPQKSILGQKQSNKLCCFYVQNTKVTLVEVIRSFAYNIADRIEAIGSNIEAPFHEDRSIHQARKKRSARVEDQTIMKQQLVQAAGFIYH